jgi:hypothetical protein
MTTLNDPSDALTAPPQPQLKYGEIVIRIGNGGDDAAPPTEYPVGTFRCVADEVSEVTAAALEQVAADVREAHRVWLDASGAPVNFEPSLGRHHRDDQ